MTDGLSRPARRIEKSYSIPSETPLSHNRQCTHRALIGNGKSANVRRSGLDLNLDSCQSAMRSWRCKTEFQFLAAKGSLANMK